MTVFLHIAPESLQKLIFLSFCIISAHGVGSEVRSLLPDAGESERGELHTSRGARLIKHGFHLLLETLTHHNLR